MTHSSLQTQCPNCQTRFRVTDEQLGVAKGKVRCGNCMSVFNAIEHQVKTTGESSTPEAPAEPTTPEESPSTADDDLVFEDNPEEDATERHYTGSALRFSDEELSDSFRGMDEPEPPGYSEHDPDSEQTPPDESWAEAILQEDDSDKPTTSDREPVPQETAPEPSPASGEEREHAQEPPEPTPPPEPETPEEPENRDNPEDFHLSVEEDERVTEPAQPSSTHTAPDSGNLYHDLRREPVSVGRSGGGLRKALWTLVVLALLGVLVAQVAWFQFDRLAAIPQLRPFYEKACELAGCTLKPLVNVEAIQSRKLVVRTDPDNRGQLIVDAVMINQAAFEQPFPAIALAFSNLNGDIVAQSTFSPDEYLAGDASDLDAMPPETPVRIAINIRDPGRDAVNYTLTFRPRSP